MNLNNESFGDFFKVGTKKSMGRLIFYYCAVSASIATIGAIPLASYEKLDIVYAGLCVSLWAAAFGGKNWAKNVELKNKENEAIKESES